jgi:hypothetical protein
MHKIRNFHEDTALSENGRVVAGSWQRNGMGPAWYV